MSWLSGRKQAGKYLGKSAKTVETWEKKFGLPVCQLPSGVRMYDTAMLDAWIRSFSKTATENMVDSILEDI